MPDPSPRATYGDLTSLLGQMRLHLKDNDVDNPVWSDAELNEFLALTGNNVYLAVADALEAETNGLARLSNIVKLGSFGNNKSVVVKNMMDRVTQYRVMGGMQICAISPNDQKITLDRDNGLTPGILW